MSARHGYSYITKARFNANPYSKILIRFAVYAVTTETGVVEAHALPPGASVQQTELNAFTCACFLAEGQ